MQRISYFEVEQFLNELVDRGMKPKLINNVLILLKQIFKHAHEPGLIFKNPLREVSMMVEPEIEVKHDSQKAFKRVHQNKVYSPCANE